MYHFYKASECLASPYRTLCGIKFVEMHDVNMSGRLLGVVVGPRSADRWAESTALEMDDPATLANVKYAEENQIMGITCCKRCARTQLWRNLIRNKTLEQELIK